MQYLLKQYVVLSFLTTRDNIYLDNFNFDSLNNKIYSSNNCDLKIIQLI